MSAKAAYIAPAVYPAMTPQPKIAGQWRFVDPTTYEGCAPPVHGAEGLLHFACIRKGGTCGYIRVGNGFKPAGDKTWKWNGLIDAPTLEPSINCLANNLKTGKKYAGCGWHAFLTNGEWTGD